MSNQKSSVVGMIMCYHCIRCLLVNFFVDNYIQFSDPINSKVNAYIDKGKAQTKYIKRNVIIHQRTDCLEPRD